MVEDFQKNKKSEFLLGNNKKCNNIDNLLKDPSNHKIKYSQSLNDNFNLSNKKNVNKHSSQKIFSLKNEKKINIIKRTKSAIGGNTILEIRRKY